MNTQHDYQKNTQHDYQKYRDALIIEKIVEKLNFDKLLKYSSKEKNYNALLFVIGGLAIEYIILDMYNYFVAGKASFITTPNSLALPAITLIGFIGLRHIREEYAHAMIDIGIEDDRTKIDNEKKENFERLTSFRLRVTIYILALISYYVFIGLVIGFADLYNISGLVAIYANTVTYPLIIIPILTDLLISYVAVHVLVPRRLKKANMGLFFYDPRNLGGFEPIGELLKQSYYIYTAILLLWFLQSHLPVLLSGIIESPYPAPDPIFQIALTGLWFVGVISIAYSMFHMHSLMKSKKRERIKSIEDDIKNMVKNPYDVNPENIDDMERYEKAQLNLEQVNQTNTYPTTFTMWSQIFLSVILPQALNMVVQLP